MKMNEKLVGEFNWQLPASTMAGAWNKTTRRVTWSETIPDHAKALPEGRSRRRWVAGLTEWTRTSIPLPLHAVAVMFHSFCVTSSSLLASPTNIQLQFRQRRRPKRGTFHYSYQLAASLIHWIDDRFFLSFLQYKKLAEHRKVNAKRWWWYDRNDQQLQQHLIQLLLVVFSPPFSADCTCGYFYYL